MSEADRLAEMVRQYVAQKRFGLEPFDPAVNKPQDVGLGGPSTEYLATEEDQHGQPFNFPTIWWDKQGKPNLMKTGDARRQALAYEYATGKKFPRYDTFGQGDFAAMNRSALGGGETMPLATLFGLR